MADEERKQSPHYIPELDPASGRTPGPGWGFLWYVVLGMMPWVGGAILYDLPTWMESFGYACAVFIPVLIIQQIVRDRRDRK